MNATHIREAFEAWILGVDVDGRKGVRYGAGDLERKGEGYVFDYVQGPWEAWEVAVEKTMRAAVERIDTLAEEYRVLGGNAEADALMCASGALSRLRI